MALLLETLWDIPKGAIAEPGGSLAPVWLRRQFLYS